MAICVLLLLLAGGLALFFRHTTGMLTSQQAAGRWGGDVGRFAQVTVFLPEYAGLSQGIVDGLISNTWGALITEGLQPDTPAGTPTFAYSAEGLLEGVSSPYRGPVNVYATGVGGNFFLFHPVPLLSGAYLPYESINRDMIVIGETLAWQLFGATDVAGMELIIGGLPFVISGVYRPLQNFASRAAYGESFHLFLYYSAMADVLGWAPITTVEAVLPNPISGVAEDIFESALEAVNVDEDDFILVNNTDRYTVFALWDVFRDFGQRSMYRTGLRLPHWENAARMVEDFAALSLVLILLLLLYPFSQAMRLLWGRWRRRKWRLQTARNTLDKLREQRREAEWKNTRALAHEEMQPLNVDEIIRQVRESEEKHEKEN